jgi:transposase
MKLHPNAPHGPKGRAEMVRRVGQGHTAVEVAEDFGVSERTVRKWLARYRAEGRQGLLDRSSRPHQMPTAVPPALVARIEALRQQRWTGQGIATKIGFHPATVHRVLKRVGLERLRKLAPRPPVQQYEWARPASCCTWTPRSWAGSRGLAIASRATAGTPPAAAAGSTRTYAWTMPRARRMSRSGPTSAKARRPASCAARRRGSGTPASGSSA